MNGNNEVWRPSVRYNPVFRSYVNELYHATTLDRNQIARLALFCAPFSAAFLSKVEVHLKAGAKIAPALWTPRDRDIWMEKGGGEDAESQTSAAEGRQAAAIVLPGRA